MTKKWEEMVCEIKWIWSEEESKCKTCKKGCPNWRKIWGAEIKWSVELNHGNKRFEIYSRQFRDGFLFFVTEAWKGVTRVAVLTVLFVFLTPDGLPDATLPWWPLSFFPFLSLLSSFPFFFLFIFRIFIPSRVVSLTFSSLPIISRSFVLFFPLPFPSFPCLAFIFFPSLSLFTFRAFSISSVSLCFLYLSISCMNFPSSLLSCSTSLSSY